jgi:hypothetical protein
VIERCLFYNNVAVAGGGAVLFYGGDSTLVDNTFLNNTIGTGAGGGVAINAPCGSRHRLLGNVFARNRITTCADSVCFGGGLGLLVGLASGASLTAVQLCSGTQVTMNSNTFEDNVVQMVLHRQGRGGGAAVSYYPTIAMAPLATANHHQAINNTFKRNCADYGGGMVIEYWSGLASGNSHNVTSNRFVENTANAESAGLRLDYGWNSSDGDHVFHRNSFLRNVARFSAGGLHVGPSFDSWNHSFELVENQFIGNIAHGFGAGAVYLHGHSIHSARFTFSRNTMQDNSAGLGGGLFVLCPNQCIGNTYLVDHNDIRNNSALIAGGGIHIRNLNAAPNTTYKFVGNTFDRNSAPSGGAVWILNGDVASDRHVRARPAVACAGSLHRLLCGRGDPLRVRTARGRPLRRNRSGLSVPSRPYRGLQDPSARLHDAAAQDRHRHSASAPLHPGSAGRASVDLLRGLCHMEVRTPALFKEVPPCVTIPGISLVEWAKYVKGPAPVNVHRLLLPPFPLFL